MRLLCNLNNYFTAAAQFALLLEYHTGNYIGIQTGYDPENDDVADYMYCEANLQNEGQEVRHTNAFIAGEIRADCEVCFDSQRVKSREVGLYSKGKLKSRLCGNVELRGPGLTPRGLSTEFAIRHDDGRIRVLIAHSPLDVIDVESVGPVLSALKLTDIVIVRERLGKRPLNLDENPDSMWLPTSSATFEADDFEGSRERFAATGEVLQENLSKGRLSACNLPILDDDDTSNSLHTHAVTTTETGIDYSKPYKRIFPGGVMIECPWTILGGVSTGMRVTYKPLMSPAAPASSPTSEVFYGAEIAFSALDDIIMQPDGSYRPSLPKVTDFFVDRLQNSS